MARLKWQTIWTIWEVRLAKQTLVKRLLAKWRTRRKVACKPIKTLYRVLTPTRDFPLALENQACSWTPCLEKWCILLPMMRSVCLLLGRFFYNKTLHQALEAFMFQVERLRATSPLRENKIQRRRSRLVWIYITLHINRQPGRDMLTTKSSAQT